MRKHFAMAATGLALAASAALTASPAQAAPMESTAVPAAVSEVTGGAVMSTTTYTMVTPTGGAVNVRSGPGTGYRILDVLYPGERAVYTGVRVGNWYKVQGIDGDPYSVGYVSASYVRIVKVTCNGTTCW